LRHNVLQNERNKTKIVKYLLAVRLNRLAEKAAENSKTRLITKSAHGVDIHIALKNLLGVNAEGFTSAVCASS
jgi:hypothetical protein